MDKNKLIATMALLFAALLTVNLVAEPWAIPLFVLIQFLLWLFELLRPSFAMATDVGVIVALKEEWTEFFKMIAGRSGGLAPTGHSSSRSPFTPKRDEATGAYDYLFKHSEQKRPFLRRAMSYFFNQGGVNYRCAATCVGEMGPVEAALAADRFINRRRPQTIVMLGIAAGIHDDVKLGDVIVAKSVGRYLDRAKVVDGEKTFEFEHGGNSFPCSKDLWRAVESLQYTHGEIYEQWWKASRMDLEEIPNWGKLCQKDWLRDKPTFVTGEIASGPVVAAAESFVKWVRLVNRNFLGLEMESGGVVVAAYDRTVVIRTLILRGISDFGDARKKKLDARGKGSLRRYAMRNSVRLLLSLLDARKLPRSRALFYRRTGI